MQRECFNTYANFVQLISHSSDSFNLFLLPHAIFASNALRRVVISTYTHISECVIGYRYTHVNDSHRLIAVCPHPMDSRLHFKTKVFNLFAVFTSWPTKSLSVFINHIHDNCVCVFQSQLTTCRRFVGSVRLLSCP